MRIVIATGGTGGHIFPALSYAKKMKQLGYEITFIGSKNRLESQLVPQNGFELITIETYGFEGTMLEKSKSIISLFQVKSEIKKIFNQLKPILVVGFGGYVSFMPLVIARTMGIKTLIHEQNSIFGKANRLLLPLVDKVLICYEVLQKGLYKNKMVLTGNPRASEVLNSYDEAYYQDLKLDADKKKVLIVMGSQGSYTVNQKMVDILNRLSDKYQYIYISGQRDYKDTVSKVNNPSVKVLAFVDQSKILVKMNLIICRAGATTLAEINAIGIPSIIIPSPFVANNHQYYNARYLVNNHAAILINEVDLNLARIQKSIKLILDDDDFSKLLANNSLKLSFPMALDKMVMQSIQLINESR